LQGIAIVAEEESSPHEGSPGIDGVVDAGLVGMVGQRSPGEKPGGAMVGDVAAEELAVLFEDVVVKEAAGVPVIEVEVGERGLLSAGDAFGRSIQRAGGGRLCRFSGSERISAAMMVSTC
jgi:hypothetical protein